MSIKNRIDYYHKVKIINDKILSFDIETTGVLLKHNGNIYLNVLHAGLDVKIIIFNDKEYNDFKYSEWSENIIVKIDNIDIKDYQFVFKTFGKKHIDPSTRCKINNNNCTYIKQVYCPINMMCGNPDLLFYSLSYEGEDIPDKGMPLHYNNRLFGVYSRFHKEKKHSYVIPIVFILKSIENETNYLMICKNNYIRNIGRFKVHGDMIFNSQLQYNINIETHFMYLSNSNKRINVNNRIDEYLTFKKYKYIQCNTHLLNWCRIFQKEIMREIITKFDSKCRKLAFDINGEKHTFVY